MLVHVISETSEGTSCSLEVFAGGFQPLVRIKVLCFRDLTLESSDVEEETAPLEWVLFGARKEPSYIERILPSELYSNLGKEAIILLLINFTRTLKVIEVIK